MKEIEILVEVYSKKEFVNDVFKKFNYIGEKETIDTYYYDPKRENLKPDKSLRLTEAFRLRKKDGKNYITYKIDNFDDNNIWLYSDEYETEVLDYNTIEKIIDKLELKPLIVINSKKKTYTHGDYEIVFEEVSGLGNFLEVEYCTDADIDINIIKKKIQSFIDELGLDVSDELNMGKPEMMLKKTRK